MFPQTDNPKSLAELGRYLDDITTRKPQRPGFLAALGETMLGQMAQSAWDAVKLPGDVYAGRVNPMSDEGIRRSFDLAGLLTLGAGAVPAGRNEMRMGIKAYHGSPHDFDRFDMSKIGTGEGAQAYGHGLYFAGDERVAKSYRDALSPLKFSGGNTTGNALLDRELMVDGDVARAIRSLSMRDFDPEAQAAAALGRKLQAEGKLDVVPSGRMYEVELNTTPDRLLDWDKPLSNQPRQVQEALGKFGIKADPEAMRKYDDALLAALDGSGPAALPRQPWDPMGGAIYESSRLVPGSYRDPAAAASALREAGVDGIRYLDAGSRAAGDGSRNYVMFDDKLVQILRKYGVATAAALPAAALAELGMTKEQAERTF